MNLLATAALCATLLAPAPDIMLPGHKSVVHELSLEIDATLDEWRLLATPVRGFGGVTLLEAGAPFDFSSKYGTKIYAFPAAEPAPEQASDEWKAAHPVAEIPVGQVSSVVAADPLARILTQLRVDAITAAGIELEVLGERRWDSSGLMLSSSFPEEQAAVQAAKRTRLQPYLIAIGALGILGLLVFVMTKRGRA